MNKSELFVLIEKLRYKILKRNFFLALIYRGMTWLLYPLMHSPKVLNNKIVNRRNREGKSLSFLIEDFLKEHPNYASRRDLVLSYFWYHIMPWEYYAYGFRRLKHKERRSFLSDADRFMLCEFRMGREQYKILSNKFAFYQQLHEFYKRKVFVFNGETNDADLKSFLSSVNSVFVKPLCGSLGRGAFVVEKESEKENLYQWLKQTSKEWILEEKIIQDERFSYWNPTSVNTVRIPSFYNGKNWHVLQPFIRMGRRGQVVDNAGAGGVFSVIDVKTGLLITDGVDEQNNRYIKHPDQGCVFKDWQIPEWGSLMNLVEQAHTFLPPRFVYVAFDFALTDKGWDLIEGNWGQMIGQIASQQGIRRQFENFLGI